MFKFIPTISAEYLFSVKQLFIGRLPAAMLDFIAAFFRRLPRSLGQRLRIEIPEDLAMFDEDVSLFRNLRNLRRINIVTHFYLEQKKYDDEPSFFSAIVRLQGRQRMGYSGYGKSLFSRDEAWRPAIGEALERWSLDHFDVERKERKGLTLSELRTTSGIDLYTVAGFPTDLREQQGRARSYKLEDTGLFDCAMVNELTSGNRLFAPLQWFSFMHAARATDRRYEPVISPICSTGAATGLSREDAEFRAIAEVVERDAFMIYWTQGLIPKKIPLTQLNSLTAQKIRDICDRYGLEVYFLYLVTDFPLHTVYVVIIDPTGVGPAVVCDSASGKRLDKCMERAFLGALALRPFVRSKMEAPVQEYQVSELTMETRVLWWSQLDRVQHIRPFLSGEYLSVDELRDNEALFSGTERDSLLEVCRNKSYKVFSRVVSPRYVTESTGLTTVMVKIPNMMPMHFHEFEKCSSGERLFSVPKSLHLTPSKMKESIPHPYA